MRLAAQAIICQVATTECLAQDVVKLKKVMNGKWVFAGFKIIKTDKKEGLFSPFFIPKQSLHMQNDCEWIQSFHFPLQSHQCVYRCAKSRQYHAPYLPQILDCHTLFR